MIRRRALSATVVSIVAAALVAGCSAEDGPPADASAAANGPVTDLRVEVVRTLPHDPDAFTQGLEISGDEIFEGTGLVGESWVEARDLDTGTPRVRADLPAPLFGEGITVDGDSLWQLTWRNGIAIERDRDTLVERRQIPIEGEGWGICRSGDRLVTSDGSDTLTFRDRDTFDPVDTIRVTDHTGGVDRLNELECTDDGAVYANIWTEDTIVRIDPGTGAVTARIDAGQLRASLDIDAGERPADVLNGIAAVPGTDRFLVTGKYWPSMFEVRFVP